MDQNYVQTLVAVLGAVSPVLVAELKGGRQAHRGSKLENVTNKALDVLIKMNYYWLPPSAANGSRAKVVGGWPEQ